MTMENESEHQAMSDCDLSALRDIGLTHDVVQGALGTAHPDDTRLARVVEVQREHVLVHDGHRTHRAVPWPGLRVALELERDALVVGDWAWWRPAPARAPAPVGTAPDEAARATADAGWVLARIPARNRLTRRDPAGGRQGLVANIDTALIVMGLDRDFNLARLDRFLVLAHGAGAEAVVVLTKADGCAAPAAAVEQVRGHVARAHAVVALDGRDPRARDVLEPWLVRGRTLVTLGSSGAGKTTLTNTVAHACATTGALRARDERGQHTTTVRTLRQVPGGACVIDTPGLRQLWLDADAEALQGAFPEIVELAARCRFRNCRHEEEPGCAVRAGVGAARLKSFHKLLRENRRDQVDVFDRQRQQALYKQRTRAARQRLFEKGR
jgi:ribosome biogenesis GTPase